MIPASSTRATTPTAHCFDIDSVNPYPIPELECDTTRIAELREWLNFDTPENNEWLRTIYGDAPPAMRQSESDDVFAIYGPSKCKHDAISTMCRGRPGAVIDTIVRKSEKRNLRVRTFTTEEVAAIIASGSVLDDEDGLVWVLPFYEEVVTADPGNRWHYWLAVYVRSRKTMYIIDSQTKQPRRTQNIRNLLTVLSDVRNEHFNILEVEVRHTQIQVAKELSESMLFVCRWIQELQQSDWRDILDAQFDHESLFADFKDNPEKQRYCLWREDTVGRAWTEERWEPEIESPIPSNEDSPDSYDGRALSVLDIHFYRDWLNRQVIMQNPQNVSPAAIRELSIYVDKYLCGIEQHIELLYGRWAFNNGAVGLLLHASDGGSASASAAGAINVTPLYPGSNVILCE